jgi:predicted nucleic acid-binding protein
MTLVLVDTNVVVSGVLAGIRESPNRLIFDAMISGTLRFILSEALLAEYREVLLRPAIVRRHGLTQADVDVLLEELVLNARLHEPVPGTADSSVPGDDHVIALLRAVPEAVLVTGDHRLHQAVARSGPAWTPAELAATLTRP